MSLHFAPARAGASSPVARILFKGPAAGAANDNSSTFASDRMLHAALRHFAQHGLNGAREARRQAEHAFFTGDRDGYDWWRGICAHLDRRLANEAFGPDRKTQPAKDVS